MHVCANVPSIRCVSIFVYLCFVSSCSVFQLLPIHGIDEQQIALQERYIENWERLLRMQKMFWIEQNTHEAEKRRTRRMIEEEDRLQQQKVEEAERNWKRKLEDDDWERKIALKARHTELELHDKEQADRFAYPDVWKVVDSIGGDTHLVSVLRQILQNYFPDSFVQRIKRGSRMASGDKATIKRLRLILCRITALRDQIVNLDLYTDADLCGFLSNKLAEQNCACVTYVDFFRERVRDQCVVTAFFDLMHRLFVDAVSDDMIRTLLIEHIRGCFSVVSSSAPEGALKRHPRVLEAMEIVRHLSKTGNLLVRDMVCLYNIFAHARALFQMHESDATVTVALHRFCLHFAVDAGGDSSWESQSVAFLLRFGTIVCGTGKKHTDFVSPMQRIFPEIFSVQMGMSYSSTEAMCATNNALVECIRQDIRPLLTRCLIVIHEEGKALQLQLVKSESMRTWFENQLRHKNEWRHAACVACGGRHQPWALGNPLCVPEAWYLDVTPLQLLVYVRNALLACGIDAREILHMEDINLQHHKVYSKNGWQYVSVDGKENSTFALAFLKNNVSYSGPFIVWLPNPTEYMGALPGQFDIPMNMPSDASVLSTLAFAWYPKLHSMQSEHRNKLIVSLQLQIDGVMRQNPLALYLHIPYFDMQSGVWRHVINEADGMRMSRIYTPPPSEVVVPQ